MTNVLCTASWLRIIQLRCPEFSSLTSLHSAAGWLSVYSLAFYLAKRKSICANKVTKAWHSFEDILAAASRGSFPFFLLFFLQFHKNFAAESSCVRINYKMVESFKIFKRPTCVFLRYSYIFHSRCNILTRMSPLWSVLLCLFKIINSETYVAY